MKAVLGVDVAKEKIDVELVNEQGEKERDELINKTNGFKKLDKWLKRNTTGPVHICMESTSIYWEELAEHMHQAGYEVSVVNPARIKGYAMSQMRRSKTDPIDAAVIADFCRTQEPKLWVPPSPEQRKLRALVRHLEALKKSRTQQLNRLETCRDPEVEASLKTILQAIETEMEQIQKRLEVFFDEHPDLKEKRELLESIKGIGEKTATHLLAEMYDLEQYENAKAVAADAGITASDFSSGKSVRRRPKMSRMGKAAIRGAMYFPALTAIRHNPLVRQLAQRLEAKGKPKKVIQVAAMRKLIHIAYGVLKNQQPFDPAYAA
jgi:transposase